MRREKEQEKKRAGKEKMLFNKIYNEDCMDTMEHMIADNQTVDLILTSPPYCTPNDNAENYSDKGFDQYQVHYDVFKGFESVDHYREWTLKLFNNYNKILKQDGVVLYNLSYTVENPSLPYICMVDIINNTDFMIADCISWKKKSALPANQNPNKLTRICEFIFVIVRKNEYSTFRMNKEYTGNGKYKNLHLNYIEAPNNDILDRKLNRLNSATFSSDLVFQLLNIYAQSDSVVYDSFMGTGTTAVACKRFGCSYIGSELSSAQCELANIRLSGVNKLKRPNVKKLF